MELKASIVKLGERIDQLKDQIQTEEATKNAFIMPFIQALGYDVFNPLEVIPEFIADIGTKKGEKIDYAIIKEGQPTILIECKHWAQVLDIHDGQLLRYFHVSNAKFGVLTNGIEYRFYTDLVEANKMDEKPFLEFKINNIKDVQIEELSKFHKSVFDVESISNTASELKYTKEIRSLFQKELQEPSSEFVKHFARQVYPSNISSRILEQFTRFVKKSTQQYISDLITERLKFALSKEDEKNKNEAATESKELEKDPVKTTQEEIEAFLIVKSIGRIAVDINRVSYRDAKTYFVILLDDNNRKTICRMYLNGSKKTIAFLDNERKEIRHEISSLNDIYQYSETIISTIEEYLKNN